MTTVLTAALARSSFGAQVTSVARLSGGTVNDVWLVRWADGAERVVKLGRDAPAGLFRAGADGLAALAGAGGVSTPEVLHCDAGLLALEVLARPGGAGPQFWERAGRAVASLHLVAGPWYGWPRDGWLGRLPQENPPTGDGYAFFAEHRVLRYLREPEVERCLTAQDRSAIERLCARLPDLVPPGGPVLTHGDLWPGNVLARAAGTPAFIDPAVSWTWADVDLSMFSCTAPPDVADRFFGGYAEVRPLDADWCRRMPVLHRSRASSPAARKEADEISTDAERSRSTTCRRVGRGLRGAGSRGVRDRGPG